MVLVKHRGIASIKALEAFCKIAMLPSGETEMQCLFLSTHPVRGKAGALAAYLQHGSMLKLPAVAYILYRLYLVFVAWCLLLSVCR